MYALLGHPLSLTHSLTMQESCWVEAWPTPHHCREWDVRLGSGEFYQDMLSTLTPNSSDKVGANLVERGDNVLVLHTGYFGDGFTDWCVMITFVRVASLNRSVQ